MALKKTAKELQPRLTTEVVRLFPRQKRWTDDAYFSLPDTNWFIELSNGVLIMPPHPTETHQRVVGKLHIDFHNFVESHNLGVVRIAPLPVRLWPGLIREPDILFVAHEHADRISEQSYGPPDLVVEVISPGTRHTDRVEKFVEYARAGVREYWIVDPQVQSIEIFVLQDGAYVLLMKVGPGEIARSQLLNGFEVSVDKVFAKS